MTIEFIELNMTQYTDGRNRTIRVLLPDDYDRTNTKKRYPVLYMHDGQNLFDASCAAYGAAWEIGGAVSNIVRDGYGGVIVVGIDNGPDRFNELCPPWNNDQAEADSARDRMRRFISHDIPKSTEASGDRYAEFIVRTLKPHIDANYNTLPGREKTGVGGSSMGGLQSLFMALNYPDVFAYAICFSPALLVIGDENAGNAFDSIDISRRDALTKLYFYCGGGDELERAFIPGCEFAANELINRGYPKERVFVRIDKEQPHNESAWAKHFPDAFKWAVGIS